jgi:hypothetical protein
VRCAAITSAGERCKLDATSGSYCWSHDPANAEERRRRARRGGKAKGAGELSEIKRRISEVIDAVLEGSQDRGRAAVAIQGYNALRAVLEQERKLKEAEVLEARIEALEAKASLGQPMKGVRQWQR